MSATSGYATTGGSIGGPYKYYPYPPHTPPSTTYIDYPGDGERLERIAKALERIVEILEKIDQREAAK